MLAHLKRSQPSDSYLRPRAGTLFNCCFVESSPKPVFQLLIFHHSLWYTKCRSLEEAVAVQGTMPDYIDLRPVWDDPVILGVKEEYWNIDHLNTTIIWRRRKNIILATERGFTLILWSETKPRSFFLKVQKGSDPLDIVFDLRTCGQRGEKKYKMIISYLRGTVKNQS